MWVVFVKLLGHNRSEQWAVIQRVEHGARPFHSPSARWHVRYDAASGGLRVSARVCTTCVALRCNLRPGVGAHVNPDRCLLTLTFPAPCRRAGLGQPAGCFLFGVAAVFISFLQVQQPPRSLINSVHIHHVSGASFLPRRLRVRRAPDGTSRRREITVGEHVVLTSLEIHRRGTVKQKAEVRIKQLTAQLLV